MQLATRKWLEVHNELEQWKQRVVSSLCAPFPTVNHENWVVCQGYSRTPSLLQNSGQRKKVR